MRKWRIEDSADIYNISGAEGHICRIRGNRRLVVSINGICAVATSYVPACFLQKLPEATKRGNPPDKPETNNGNL